MARPLLAIVAVALGLAVFQPAIAVVPPLKQPTWVELAPEQRQILAPLAGEWDNFEYSRRKKWIGIAQRYPAMNTEEQVRVQRRMVEWAKLSPEERTRAREKYKNLQRATAANKEAIRQKWQEYKDLPEEEKLRLQAEAAARAKNRSKSTMVPKPPAAAGSQKPAALPLPALNVSSPSAPPAAPEAPSAPAVPADPAAPANL